MAIDTWRAIVARLALLVVRVLAWARPVEFRAIPTGHRFLLVRGGRLLPVIAGASGEDEGDGDDDESKNDGDEAATGDDDDADESKNDDAADDGDAKRDAEAAGDGTSDIDPREPDWRRESRKHERRSKAEKKRADDLARQLKEYQDKEKSERDRAVEEALKRGRDEALAEAEKERRADRLEIAVTRLAAKGIKVGSGDDARTLRFDDPEDALVFIERAIARGDLDPEDVFDEKGRVKQDAIEEELADLLERKPRLAAIDAAERERQKKKDPGEIDAGKGKGAKGADDDMTPDEHFKAITAR